MRLPEKFMIAYAQRTARKIASDDAQFGAAIAFYILEAAAKACGGAVLTRFQKLGPELDELLDAIALALEERWGSSS